MKCKKLILTFALIVCVLAGGFVFSACKKDGGYALKNLRVDYISCYKNSVSFYYDESANSIENNLYSATSDDFKAILATAPYNCLDSYVSLLNYATAFASSYSGVCASDGNNVDKDLRNEVKTLLDEYKASIESIDLLAKNFRSNIMLTLSDPAYEINKELPYSFVHLNSFKRLLDAYEQAIENAYELNISLSKIYFGYVYKANNIDPSTSPYSNSFDSTNILISLPSKFKFEISLLAYRYYQDNIKYTETTENIITKQSNGSYGSLGSEFESLQTKVKSISKIVSLSATSYTNIEEFYNSATALYNVQACLNNDFEMFYKASHEIDYAQAKTSFRQTKRVIACMEIIESYNHLIDENYSALARIASLL